MTQYELAYMDAWMAYQASDDSDRKKELGRIMDHAQDQFPTNESFFTFFETLKEVKCTIVAVAPDANGKG